MARLIMMRHGESVWNAKNQFTGWVDVPLSRKGVEEALEGGRMISEMPIDVVYVSTLNRAQTTAVLALSEHKSGRTPIFKHSEGTRLEDWGKIYNEAALEGQIPVFIAWQLNERYYGELQGLNKQETRNKYGDEQVLIWRRSFDVPPPNGESLKMTAERTIPFFKEVIVPNLEEGKNVFISAHGNSLRSIVMELDQLSPDEVVKLEIATGAPISYNYENGHFVKVSPKSVVG